MYSIESSLVSFDKRSTNMGQKRSQNRFAISLAVIQLLLAVFYGVFVRYGGSADAINFNNNKEAWQAIAITYPCETTV